MDSRFAPTREIESPRFGDASQTLARAYTDLGIERNRRIGVEIRTDESSKATRDSNIIRLSRESTFHRSRFRFRAHLHFPDKLPRADGRSAINGDVFPRQGVIGSTRSRGVDLADLPRISSLLFFFLSPRGFARGNNDENLKSSLVRRYPPSPYLGERSFSFANWFTCTAYAI